MKKTVIITLTALFVLIVGMFILSIPVGDRLTSCTLNAANEISREFNQEAGSLENEAKNQEKKRAKLSSAIQTCRMQVATEMYLPLFLLQPLMYFKLVMS